MLWLQELGKHRAGFWVSTRVRGGGALCWRPHALGRVTRRHCVTLMHSGTQHLISATPALCVRRHPH